MPGCPEQPGEPSQDLGASPSARFAALPATHRVLRSHCNRWTGSEASRAPTRTQPCRPSTQIPRWTLSTDANSAVDLSIDASLAVEPSDAGRVSHPLGTAAKKAVAKTPNKRASQGPRSRFMAASTIPKQQTKAKKKAKAQPVRSTVRSYCHLELVHRHKLRVSGCAPDALTWHAKGWVSGGDHHPAKA